MIFDNPIFAGWYTDIVDVYRVVNVTEGNIDTQTWQQVGKSIPCRVYNSQKNGPSMQDSASRITSNDKLSCDIGTDIREGDKLLVTRGGALGFQNQTERYFAGNPQNYFDPVEGAVTGLSHMEVGLMLQEIVR